MLSMEMLPGLFFPCVHLMSPVGPEPGSDQWPSNPAGGRPQGEAGDSRKGGCFWLPGCLVALLMLFTCKKMMKKMLGFKLWNPHIMNSCSGPPPPVWKWWPKMTLHIHLHRWSWLMSRQRMSLTNWRTTHSLHLWKCFHPSRMFMNIVLFHLHSSPLWQKDRICSFFLHDAQGIGFWWIFFADLSIIRSVIAFYAWISNCCHLLRWS